MRPGLVYGGEEKGLFGQLCGIVERTPILPAFLPAAKVQPIHVDDLAAGLVEAAASRLRGSWQLASATPISLTQFIRLMARIRLRRRRVFFPVPSALLLAAEPLLRRFMSQGPDLTQLRALQLPGRPPGQCVRDRHQAGRADRSPIGSFSALFRPIDNDFGLRSVRRGPIKVVCGKVAAAGQRCVSISIRLREGIPSECGLCAMSAASRLTIPRISSSGKLLLAPSARRRFAFAASYTC